jgi:hypothetical protein
MLFAALGARGPKRATTAPFPVPSLNRRSPSKFALT